MDIQFIEPCCVSKQLPSLLKEQKVALFQTNGDVTFEHIIKAVSSLAGNELSIKFMVPTINVELLRVLSWYGRRGWLKRLQVVTHENQAQLIHKEISGNGPLVTCYHHERIVESLLVIDGEIGTVAVSGQFLSNVSPGHRFYMSVLGKADNDHVRMLTATANPFMRKEDTISIEEPELNSPVTDATEDVAKDVQEDVQGSSVTVTKKSKKK